MATGTLVSRFWVETYIYDIKKYRLLSLIDELSNFCNQTPTNFR